ncbi:MAG: hypothetical protein OSA48_05660 [Akkermansiaceae bacterium]|nr:hypothetical protein [Akkermansiaceae bacterium]
MTRCLLRIFIGVFVFILVCFLFSLAQVMSGFKPSDFGALGGTAIVLIVAWLAIKGAKWAAVRMVKHPVTTPPPSSVIKPDE